MSVCLILAFLAVPNKTFAAEKTKTVYVVSSVDQTWDCSTKANPNDVTSFTAKLKYNKNGLITKHTTNAKKKLTKAEEVCGSHTFSYKGKKLVKETSVADKDTRKYKYKKGVLKSSKWIFSKDDYLPYKYKVNANGRITRVTNLYDEKTFYKYDAKGNLVKSYMEYEIEFNNYSYDDKGNLVKYTYSGPETPFSRTIEEFVDTAVNTYDSEGRLTATTITRWDGSTIKATVKYKRIKVPKSYYKAVVAQQHDIIMRYVHDQDTGLPMGIVRW